MRCPKCGNIDRFNLTVLVGVFATTNNVEAKFNVTWDDEAPLRNTTFAASECTRIMCLECGHVLKNELSPGDRLTNVLSGIVNHINHLKWTRGHGMPICLK